LLQGSIQFSILQNISAAVCPQSAHAARANKVNVELLERKMLGLFNPRHLVDWTRRVAGNAQARDW